MVQLGTIVVQKICISRFSKFARVGASVTDVDNSVCAFPPDKYNEKLLLRLQTIYYYFLFFKLIYYKKELIKF